MFAVKHLICALCLICGTAKTHNKSTFYTSKDTQNNRDEVNFLRYFNSLSLGFLAYEMDR